MKRAHLLSWALLPTFSNCGTLQAQGGYDLAIYGRGHLALKKITPNLDYCGGVAVNLSDSKDRGPWISVIPAALRWKSSYEAGVLYGVSRHQSLYNFKEAFRGYLSLGLIQGRMPSTLLLQLEKNYPLLGLSTQFRFLEGRVLGKLYRLGLQSDAFLRNPQTWKLEKLKDIFRFHASWDFIKVSAGLPNWKAFEIGFSFTNSPSYNEAPFEAVQRLTVPVEEKNLSQSRQGNSLPTAQPIEKKEAQADSDGENPMDEPKLSSLSNEIVESQVSEELPVKAEVENSEAKVAEGVAVLEEAKSADEIVESQDSEELSVKTEVESSEAQIAEGVAVLEEAKSADEIVESQVLEELPVKTEVENLEAKVAEGAAVLEEVKKSDTSEGVDLTRSTSWLEQGLEQFRKQFRQIGDQISESLSPKPKPAQPETLPGGKSPEKLNLRKAKSSRSNKAANLTV